jgi:hypothetical protein
MSVSRQQNVSEATAQKIDGEIRRLVEAGYAEATRILSAQKHDLEALAQGLLEYETLSGDEHHRFVGRNRRLRDTGDEPLFARRAGGALGREGSPPGRPRCGSGAAASGLGFRDVRTEFTGAPGLLAGRVRDRADIAALLRAKRSRPGAGLPRSSRPTPGALISIVAALHAMLEVFSV